MICPVSLVHPVQAGQPGRFLPGSTGHFRRVRVIPGRAGRGVQEVLGSVAVLLPYSPASVADARWRLTADLRRAGVFPAAVSDAELVVSELLSNAIRHAHPLPGSLVQVSWELDGHSVQIAVSDGGGPTQPQPAQPSLSSLGGRGLAIVDHLSSHWGVSGNGSQTTVWAVVPAPRRGTAGRGMRGCPDDAALTA